MNPRIYVNEVNERQGVFTRRAFLMAGVTGVGVVALGSRLAALQLVETDRYKELSEHNQFDFRLQPPPRGLILDRNGIVLATNRADFRLFVSRDNDTDVNDLLDRVGKLVPIDDAHRARLIEDIHNAPSRAPVTVMEDLTWEEFSRINVRAPELPGVTADTSEIRVYPYSGAFAHVLGYVAKVTQADVTSEQAEAAKHGGTVDPILLNPGFRIGKAGLEKTYDLAMRGRAGAKKVEVDVKGRVIRDDPGGDLAPTPGQQLVLTLDADVQNRALEMFGADSGAAVMMDCRTGDVLCMLSAPSFDANLFVKGLTSPEYQALAGYDRKPLLNKALDATYPPGSTFKTMVALTALEHGISPDKTRTCGGVWVFGGHPFHCDQAHGTLNMHDAIARSCDIFFFQTAVDLGPDIIAETARHFGIGQTFLDGVPIEQKAGVLPDTAWKWKTFHDRWWPGETPSVGIGQGALAITPLQSCVMCARLANGNKMLMPRLVKSVGGQQLPAGNVAPDLPYAKEHLAFIRDAMLAVTVSGTAAGKANLGLGPIQMAGKTGTAQVHSGHSAHGAVGAWESRDHAWFIAFAPYDDPRYAVSVITEHGGFGADASAPKAREILRVALLKDPEIRARIEQPLPTIPAPGATSPPAGPPPATTAAVNARAAQT